MLGAQVKVLRLLQSEYLGEGFHLMDKMPSPACIKRISTRRGIFHQRSKVPTFCIAEAKECAPQGPLAKAYGQVEWLGEHEALQHEWASIYCLDADEPNVDNERDVDAYYCHFLTSAALAVVVPPAHLRGSLRPPPALTPAHLLISPRQQMPAAETTSDPAGAAAGSSRGGSGGGGGEPKRQELADRLHSHRQIHVCGGGAATTAVGGKCTVRLGPGEGLRELKTQIRAVFGKVRYSVLGQLLLVDAQGRAVAPAKAGDLVCGARVQCTYTNSGGIYGMMYGNSGSRSVTLVNGMTIDY